MNAETKLFAAYQDSYYGTKEGVEVADEQDAVQQAGPGVTRFSLYEQTSQVVDGETLTGKPKNHTPYIYINVNKVLSLQDVIAYHKNELAAEEAHTLNDAFSKSMRVAAIKDVIAHLEKNDPATCFVPDAGGRGDFIRLKDGEKAYDAQGKLVWPVPAVSSPVSDPAPAV